ncbi:MAG: hypothetical protein Q7R49_03430 [Candidatus Daviesbacteria bacterium]|nr:hypothetical protein [Candidatus Daviesbacteria bacterium]
MTEGQPYNSNLVTEIAKVIAITLPIEVVVQLAATLVLNKMGVNLDFPVMTAISAPVPTIMATRAIILACNPTVS